jgi:LmbE family N-acetylglucosaminyl deacetylase
MLHLRNFLGEAQMNVLCVMAHPDDEVLGCGGTLAKHAENGDSVFVRILSTRSREISTQASQAFMALGLVHKEEHVSVPFLVASRFPDQQADTVPFRTLADWVWGESPDADIIYTHHPGDLNLDHALTAQAVLTAFRPKPGEKPRTILASEIGSSTEWTFPQVFQPNWFVELDSFHVDKKVAAMNCYPSEIADIPHPRSEDGITTAAQWRGQQAGVNWAEAFQLLRRSC